MKNKIVVCLGMVISTFVGPSIALADSSAEHLNHRPDHCEFHDNASKLKCQESTSRKPKPLSPKSNTITVQCGDTITTSATIANDLICPNITGYALSISGDNIVVDGQGHKIEAANSIAGIFVSGKNVSVTGFKANGMFQGMLAYNSPQVKITGNDFSKNQYGIVLYAESMSMDQAVVSGNKAGANISGIRTGQDGTGGLINPSIRNNDFSKSTGYAMDIEAASLELDQSLTTNSMSGSMNGLFLGGGSFFLHDFSLVCQNIQEVQIFVATATNFKVNNLNLSTNVPANSSQARIALDLYRVANFDINALVAKNNDVGVKLETELGATPQGTIHNSQFSKNVFSGVDISSYDSSSYGVLKITGNCFKEGPGVPNILLAGHTQIAAGSVFQTQSCDSCSR